MSGQEAARGLGIHAVMTFEIWNELRRQRLAPRPVINAVDELARAAGTRLIDPHPDHRWSLTRLHVIPAGDADVVERAQRAAEALSVVDRRIDLTRTGCIVRRRHDPTMDRHRPTPEV